MHGKQNSAPATIAVPTNKNWCRVAYIQQEQVMPCTELILDNELTLLSAVLPKHQGMTTNDGRANYDMIEAFAKL
jgi:hypothetical protein